MTQEYEPSQDPNATPRRTGEGPNTWGRMMYERDMAYGVYQALREALENKDWMHDATVPTGFYGRDYPDA